MDSRHHKFTIPLNIALDEADEIRAINQDTIPTNKQTIKTASIMFRFLVDFPDLQLRDCHITPQGEIIFSYNGYDLWINKDNYRIFETKESK
jgi:hypothetical protein